MPETDSFVDQAKAALLYEHRQGNDIESMLDESETNTNVNDGSVKVAVLFYQKRLAWRGRYADIGGELDRVIHRLYLNYDGYARNQAISMAHAKVVPVGAGEEKKRGGLLGMLGR